MSLEDRLLYKIIIFILGAIIISIFGLSFSLYIGDFMCDFLYALPGGMRHSVHDDIEKYGMISMFILYIFLFIFYCKVCFVNAKKIFGKNNKDDKNLTIFKIILLIYAVIIIFIIFYKIFF